MQRGIRSEKAYKGFSSKQVKNNLSLSLSNFDALGKTVLDFVKFIDWVVLSALRSVYVFINTVKNFRSMDKLTKSAYSFNKYILYAFPAKRSLINFSVLIVLAIATNPWLNNSLFNQHFYSLGFKIFLDILFSFSLIGAAIHSYSFIIREFKRFRIKQLKEYHNKLLEREKACRQKPVKNLHSLCS